MSAFLQLAEGWTKRRHAECFDLATLITGRRSKYALGPNDNSSLIDVELFTDSLAEYLRRIQKERDDLLRRVFELERECDGLKLTLRRDGT